MFPSSTIFAHPAHRSALTRFISGESLRNKTYVPRICLRRDRHLRRRATAAISDIHVPYCLCVYNSSPPPCYTIDCDIYKCIRELVVELLFSAASRSYIERCCHQALLSLTLSRTGACDQRKRLMRFIIIRAGPFESLVRGHLFLIRFWTVILQ